MRCQLIAECCTNWAGDRALLVDMIRAAADAGADICKFQSYDVAHLRHGDPQREWFTLNALTDDDHALIRQACEDAGVHPLFTAFHLSDLERLHRLGFLTVKIGSGEGRTQLVYQASKQFVQVFASLPWGVGSTDGAKGVTFFSTIPLYPAPAECYARVKRQSGYSDHHIGTNVAKIAIAHGAAYLEKHFHIPGKGRNQEWNMSPDDLRDLRAWAETCDQVLSGTKFEGRWCA